MQMPDQPERKMTFLDRVVSVVSPETALQRMVSREKLHNFAATRRGSKARGRMANAWDQASSESWKKNRERIDAIWEARAMEENFCMISGLLQRLGMYICGSLQYVPATGNEKTDQIYADFFHDWCGRADLTGRHRLKTMAQLGVQSAIRDGEHGWIEHIQDGELRLQAIEGDRIGNPQDPKLSDEKNIAGIHIDDFGKVTGYDIFKRSKSSTHYSLEGQVKPEHFIHLFYPNRTDQYHGVSKLAPALPHARDLYELLGFEKTAAKFASSFAGFVRMKDPGAPGAAQWDDKPEGSGQPATLRVESGTVMRVEAGTEEIVFPPGTQRPSGAFIALLEALIREIALGINLPYGFVYNMAVFGGVTARLEVQAIQRVIRSYQERLEEVLLDRVKKKVLMLGIAMGRIPATKHWNRGSWRYGAAITGDVGHQTSADIELVRQGAKTISALAIEHGYDFGEVMETKAAEIARIKKISEAQGIPMELLMNGETQATTMFANMERAKAGLPGPEDPPPPPPGLIGVVGDKGAKTLLDLLEKVGSGLIDRDSGIMAAMRLFGLTFIQADKIMPQGPPTMALPPAAPMAPALPAPRAAVRRQGPLR